MKCSFDLEGLSYIELKFQQKVVSRLVIKVTCKKLSLFLEIVTNLKKEIKNIQNEFLSVENDKI